MRVLVVEDEVKLAEIIGRILKKEHYDVELANDGDTGLQLALSDSFDMVVLDRMLPRVDGLEICRQMRKVGISVPVLILSARRETPERVEGLDCGADDYLGKPFAVTELLARIRALTRRRERPIMPDRLVLDNVSLDSRTHQVWRGDEQVELSPREFALLEYLMRNAGQVLSRDQILDRVWGYGNEPEGNVVDLYIHYLRKKLDCGKSRSLIQTVRGAGYVIRDSDD